MWAISKVDGSMVGHEMFDLGYIVSYGAFRDMVRVHYLDLNLFQLPSSAKNINEFIAMICMMDSEARLD